MSDQALRIAADGVDDFGRKGIGGECRVPGVAGFALCADQGGESENEPVAMVHEGYAYVFL